MPRQPCRLHWDERPYRHNWLCCYYSLHQETERAKEQVTKALTVLNKYLLTRTFLVGESITQADISLACNLLMLYEQVSQLHRSWGHAQVYHLACCQQGSKASQHITQVKITFIRSLMLYEQACQLHCSTCRVWHDPNLQFHVLQTGQQALQYITQAKIAQTCSLTPYKQMGHLHCSTCRCWLDPGL